MDPAIFFRTAFVAKILSVSGGPLFAPKAYLDPGSGSYILQILVGALLGAGFIIKVYWGRIKSFVSGLFSGGQKDQTDDE